MSAAGEHVFVERPTPGDDQFQAHAARYLRAATRVPAGSAVLDVGSGTGYGAAILAASGNAMTGVDRSEEAVRAAAAAYPHVRFVVADALALPFQDGSFDAALCFEVIEHVEDPAVLAHELARVLRPGGLLFLSTPNARMEELHARSEGFGHNPFHVSPLQPRDLRKLMRSSGLEPILYGQARDRGAIHVLLQSLDPFGLRLRLAPRRRATIHAALQRTAGVAPGTEPPFRFSRLLARSAVTTYVEARKGDER